MRFVDRLRALRRTEERTAHAVQRGGDPPPVPKVVVRRWVQLVLLPLALLALWALARAVGTLFLVIVVACLVALVLAPTVRLFSKVLPRGLSIVAAYVAVLVVFAAIGVLLVSPIASQITHFQSTLPSLTKSANRELADIQRSLDKHGINVHITKQGQSALTTLQKSLAKRSGDIVSFSRGLLSSVVTIGIDLILIVVLSIYMLIYGADIGRLVRRVMPAGDGSPDDDFPTLVQHAVSSYVRGQLLFSVIMGASAAIVNLIFGLVGLFPDGERYAIFLGVFYGLMEFIPYIGPVVGPVPALVLALFQHPIAALWLLLAFLALQQLEGHIVAPQVFRLSLRINPILIIVGLLIGDELYGIPGALIALPVLAVLRETVLYLRRHTTFEPWGPVIPAVITEATATGGPAPPSLALLDPPAADPAPEPTP